MNANIKQAEELIKDLRKHSDQRGLPAIMIICMIVLMKKYIKDLQREEVLK